MAELFSYFQSFFSLVWQGMWTSPSMRLWVGLALGCLLVLFFGGRGLWRLRQTCCLRAAGASDSGVASMEFMLVLPILLFCTLTLAQTTLVMGGQMFVHYAAFAAARSAIVTLPRVVVSTAEGRNQVRIPDGWKIQHIRKAAVFAMLPAAGRATDSSSQESDALVQGMRSYYQTYNHPVPHWVDSLLAQRFFYADQHTAVVLMRQRPSGQGVVSWEDLTEGSHVFGPREPVRVRVEHQLHLAVPYVWLLFADHVSARHTLVRATALMLNAGMDTRLPASPMQPPDFTIPLERL